MNQKISSTNAAISMSCSDILALEPTNESRFSDILENSAQTWNEHDCIPKSLLSESESDTEVETSDLKESASDSFIFVANDEKNTTMTVEHEGRKTDCESRTSGFVSVNRYSSVYVPKVSKSDKINSGSLLMTVNKIETGRWHCETCNFLNLESDSNCQKCVSFKSLSLPESMKPDPENLSIFSVSVPFVEAKKKLPRRDGDWFCTSCRNLNFSFRLTCNKCKESKLSTGVACIPIRSLQKSKDGK